MRFFGGCRAFGRKLKNFFWLKSGERSGLEPESGEARFVAIARVLCCGAGLIVGASQAKADSYDQISDLPVSDLPGQYNLPSNDNTAETPVNYANESKSSSGSASADTGGDRVINYFPDASDKGSARSSDSDDGSNNAGGTSTGEVVAPQTPNNPTNEWDNANLELEASAGTATSDSNNRYLAGYLTKKGDGVLTLTGDTELYAKEGINTAFPVDPTSPPPVGAASIEGGELVVDGQDRVGGNTVGTNSYTVVGRGKGSDATLTIKNGAGFVVGSPVNGPSQVPSSVLIGLGGGSNAVVNVDGVNGDGQTHSELVAYGHNGAVTVGNGDPKYGQGTAHGTLNLTNGGIVYSDRVILGNYSQAEGTVNVGCPTCSAGSTGQTSTLNAGGAIVSGSNSLQVTADSGLYVNSSGKGTVNIYEHGVVAVRGQLRFGAPGAYNTNSGYGEVNINHGGVLQVGDTKANNGTLYNGIVSNERNYALNINDGGTLQLINDHSTLTTDVNIHLDGNANIQTNNGTAYFSGNIMGSGDLNVNDNTAGAAGEVLLASANSYTGATIINQGDVRLVGNGMTGSGRILLGARAVKNSSSGSQTVNTGSLIIDKDATTILNQDIIHDPNADSATDGGIRQQGAGLTILNGKNTYKGETHIYNGTLRIDGDQGGTKENNYQDGATGLTTVEEHGTLSGHGTIGGNVLVAGGGVLAPAVGRQSGDVNNDLKINGTLDLRNASQLVLVTNSGERQLAVVDMHGKETGGNYLNSDSVTVKGQVTVRPNAIIEVKRGSLIRYDHAYRLITSQTGISGDIGQINKNARTPSYYFLTPSFYFVDGDAGDDPRGLDFRLDRNDKNFEDVSWTHNEHEVGRVLDHLSSDSDIVQAVAQVGSADEARAAQKSLAGEIHASLRTALIEDSYYLREAIVNRIAQSICDDNMVGSNIHTADLRTHRRDDGRCIKGRPVLWGQAYGSFGHISGNSNASAMHHSTAGFIMGADAPIRGNDDWRIGAVVSYGHSMFNLAGEDSSGNSNNISVGAYSGGRINNFRLAVGADYTWNMITTNRHFSIAGYGDSLHAHYDGGTAQVYADLAYPFHLGRVTQLEPFVNASYVNLNTNKIHETGTYGMLRVKSKDDSVVYTTVGVRASTKVMVDDVMITPHVMVAYRHGFGDMRSKVKSRFTDGGGDMDIRGLALSEDEIVLDLGMRVNVTHNLNLDISYIGQYGGRSTASGAKADLKARF